MVFSNSDEMFAKEQIHTMLLLTFIKSRKIEKRRTDAEVAAGANIIEEVATKNSEQTISQLVANKDTKALAEHLKEGMKNYLGFRTV